MKPEYIASALDLAAGTMLPRPSLINMGTISSTRHQLLISCSWAPTSCLGLMEGLILHTLSSTPTKQACICAHATDSEISALPCDVKMHLVPMVAIEYRGCGGRERRVRSLASRAGGLLLHLHPRVAHISSKQSFYVNRSVTQISLMCTAHVDSSINWSSYPLSSRLLEQGSVKGSSAADMRGGAISISVRSAHTCKVAERFGRSATACVL